MSEKEVITTPKKGASPVNGDTKAPAEAPPKPALAADLLAIYAEGKELATRQERQAAEARADLAEFQASASARLQAIAKNSPGLAVAAENAAKSGLLQGASPAAILAAVDPLTTTALQLQHQGY